jgi:hypothetical protein
MRLKKRNTKWVVNQVMKSWALRMKKVLANRVGKRVVMGLGG